MAKEYLDLVAELVLPDDAMVEHLLVVRQPTQWKRRLHECGCFRCQCSARNTIERSGSDLRALQASGSWNAARRASMRSRTTIGKLLAYDEQVVR